MTLQQVIRRWIAVVAGAVAAAVQEAVAEEAAGAAAAARTRRATAAPRMPRPGAPPTPTHMSITALASRRRRSAGRLLGHPQGAGRKDGGEKLLHMAFHFPNQTFWTIYCFIYHQCIDS